ncbi:hypothetical protein BCY91_10420 [Pelobium manganitolerans]|uniref:Uncharacterized protein n=1 Tax=Pelobium manganitolerans TaxID=1842495 RepID=A0A419S2M9_9SPHI|nr:hypothetical protein BCY91_10420 [Pelobium manganitolerans]
MNEKTANIKRIWTIMPAANTNTPSAQPTKKSIINMFKINLMTVFYQNGDTKDMPLNGRISSLTLVF